MIGAEVLSRFEEAGYALSLEGEELRACGPAAPAEDLQALVDENRHALKAAVLLSDPPDWLVRLLNLYASGHETEVKRTSPATGKAEVYFVRVQVSNIVAAVGAELGLPVSEWEAIRLEVEAVASSWEAGKVVSFRPGDDDGPPPRTTPVETPKERSKRRREERETVKRYEALVEERMTSLEDETLSGAV